MKSWQQTNIFERRFYWLVGKENLILLLIEQYRVRLWSGWSEVANGLPPLRHFLEKTCSPQEH